MIAGLDSPSIGELKVGSTVEVMYVDQNREGLDDPELSVYDAVTDGAEEIELGPRSINRYIVLVEKTWSSATAHSGWPVRCSCYMSKA